MNCSIIGGGRIKSNRSLWRSEILCVALRSSSSSHSHSCSRGVSVAMSLSMSSPTNASARTLSIRSVRVHLCLDGGDCVGMLNRGPNPLHQAEPVPGNAVFGWPISSMDVAAPPQLVHDLWHLQLIGPLTVRRVAVLLHVEQDQEVIESQAERGRQFRMGSLNRLWAGQKHRCQRYRLAQSRRVPGP